MVGRGGGGIVRRVTFGSIRAYRKRRTTVRNRDEALPWMYKSMVESRHYEETMAAFYLEGRLPPKIQKGHAFDIGSGPVPGEMHLAAGQEPVAVGVCAHLKQ